MNVTNSPCGLKSYMYLVWRFGMQIFFNGQQAKSMRNEEGWILLMAGNSFIVKPSQVNTLFRPSGIMWWCDFTLSTSNRPQGNKMATLPKQLICESHYIVMDIIMTYDKAKYFYLTEFCKRVHGTLFKIRSNDISSNQKCRMNWSILCTTQTYAYFAHRAFSCGFTVLRLEDVQLLRQCMF